MGAAARGRGARGRHWRTMRRRSVLARPGASLAAPNSHLVCVLCVCAALRAFLVQENERRRRILAGVVLTLTPCPPVSSQVVRPRLERQR